ncbi:hypothetical protein CGCF415_v005265 [Colletotrichum fructicola]|uniref:Uncharacterized protein n=3 Tax=Colletotrichum gloeosporioides species complex TaxID=2707338 RepID=L2G2A8_COLFN|nr:uncharacterized protein CGMCC3_g11622 [Colletotrichum fructicola]XP_036499432.1 uncharacterized protein CGCS363_v002596 [Colletotrichum siamense]XP_037183633.1 uncharacterized protein CGCA056_v003366 [Colletotrichum aenigma]XP_045259838.1 uncharacterized protein GCG54_00003578 [Colletotrichum gloeosporioides]XP_053037334.1 uncharacterized protein COL26b_005856 [Colletotrichum chrysophilum]EQB57596.1 hypothetical protein CGLO_02254 [Colletotrichum gloeosporioides Cg-14]KAF4483327.1 hypothet
MCIIISTLYVECMHKHYQNTFKCASARGSSLFQSSRNFTLERTIHLPDQQPKQIPHPLCDGNIKKATRPVTGRCKTCIREEKELKQLLEDARRARDAAPDDAVTEKNARNSVLGLQQLVAATKRMDLDD